MKKITRNKAAEMLGVTSQTVTNYYKEGLIGGFVGKKNILYLNADDIGRFAKKYKMISVSEKMLDEKLAELKAAREEAKNELSEIRRTLIGKRNYGCFALDVAKMVSVMYYADFVPGMSDREHDILVDYISGFSDDELVEKYGVSRERIRQVIVKGCRRFSENMDKIACNVRKNNELEYEIERLKALNEAIQADYDKYRLEHDDNPISEDALPPGVLDIKVCDVVEFDTRILNAFKNKDIFTVGDILTRYSSLLDLKKIRNFGAKCLELINDYITDNNLLFKIPTESDVEYYIRLNKNLKNHETEN